MKALLINPAVSPDDFITEIEIGDNWYDISKAIDCECFTVVSTDLLGETHSCYVDDEGLINGTMQKDGAFYCRDYPHPLAGKGLILGLDPDTGESIDATISVTQAQKIFGYPSPIGPVYRA